MQSADFLSIKFMLRGHKSHYGTKVTKKKVLTFWLYSM